MDIVYLPRFKKALIRGGENFLKRVFLERELNLFRGSPQSLSLAAIFAAKEAVIKALSMNPGSWHDISISHKENGSPKVQILNHKSKILNHSISISHDGDYVIAHFVALLKN